MTKDTPTGQGLSAWKLVPVEPTEEMCARGITADRSPETQAATNTLDRQLGLTRDIYRAMLSAAPKPLFEAVDDEVTEGCIACLVTFREGDEYLPDESGGNIHFACCGPEREGFTRPGGEPLGPDDPIPTPCKWSALLAAAPSAPQVEGEGR